MHRFFLAVVPLLRGALLACLLAGLSDAMALVLGGGADFRALAQGAVLLALAMGFVHEGAGAAPFQASFLWLALGAALPIFSGVAPAAAIGGLVFLLPLRALGARLSGMLAMEEDAARSLALHLSGALLGLAWTAEHGLGLLGYLIAFAGCGLLTTRLPAPALDSCEEELTARERGSNRLARFAAGAGLTWSFLLLAPAARAFDASSAQQDAVAVLCLLVLVGAGWWTLGALAAQSPRRPVWAALTAAAAALLLPMMSSAIQQISQPLNFEARLSAGFLRRIGGADAPRLPEEHGLYLPWVLLFTIALPAILGGVALRSALGRKPGGPDDVAPLLAGAGAALVVFSLPLGADGSAPWLGLAAMIALLAAAAADLLGQHGAPAPRLAAGSAIAVAALFLIRDFRAPEIAYPMQDAREWHVAKDAAGRALSVAGRSAPARIVEHLGGRPEQYLASGRNRLTPELDAPGLWTRDVDLALQCAPGAERVLMAGAPHPASLRALASAGVKSATVAADPALTSLLGRRDPGGYGLELSYAPTLARASRRHDLVLLRSQAMWDEDHSLLRPWAATQARHHLAPGGVCVLAVDPEQLVPGMLPALAAVWRKVFAVSELLIEPDGLRGARLLLVGWKGSGELPAALRPLAVPAAWLDRIAAAGSIPGLMAPLPREHGRLSETAWRLVDELRAARRAQAVLEELAHAADADAAPCLLVFAARQYAAQEYSTHDTFQSVGADAVEVAEPALDELLRLARAWPDSDWLRATWADVGGTLAAKREVALVEKYLSPLREELGWRDAGISLPLAQAAIELLDEERARMLLDEVLLAHPGHPAALHLQAVLAGEEELVPDAHAGHGHD